AQPVPGQPSGVEPQRQGQPSIFGPAQSAPPQQGEGKKKKGGFGGLIVLVLVAGAIFGGSWFLNRDNIDKAAVGDCVAVDESDTEDPFSIADCADAASSLKVLKLISGSSEKCKDVPGASQSTTGDGVEVCMGDKDVDPATAVNAAKEGDCLAISGNDAKKVDCASPEAENKVLKRLTDVSDFEVKNACSDVKDATASYSWKWETKNSVINIPSLSTDVVLCLGPN
ncbi:MAG: LppU/SCO3897 family protein, partial [Anaerolineales bacterium]